jgi:SpoVK/Ycf46/Vps4 family AAA+-type ATPase
VIAHLDDARTLRALREAIAHFASTGGTLFLIDHREGLPAGVASDATRLELSLPDEAEVLDLVRKALRRIHRRRALEVKLSRDELQAVVRNLCGLSRRQAEQIVADITANDRRLDANDLNAIMAAKRRCLERDGVLEFVAAPVDLTDIGGLDHLKEWLRQRRAALTPRARSFGLALPRGILLLGVQGAGKSLCAKAVAAAWQRPLLRLDPGTLYDRYVGESERRLRQALRQAELMAPVVLWVDEIEKGFASAAAHSTDGGLSQRMFGTLLTWMQEHSAPVFLVATANAVHALPPELLRKGRFDEIFFVDLPPDEARRAILSIHLRRRGRDPEAFDLDALVRASSGYTGAEIEQAIMTALHGAFDVGADLDTARVLAALEGSPPLSVTMAEQVHALRRWAAGRCVPA